MAIAAALVACTPSPTAEGEAGEVVAVVDGDTIDVATSRGDFRVRLIGIDSPEIGRNGSWSPTPSQGDTDRYGRLLRHVLLDGDSAAVEAGAGTEYTYDAPYAGHHAPPARTSRRLPASAASGMPALPR